MENQEKIWDSIAQQWDNFRARPERIIEYFRDRYAKNKGKIVDLGCGNCRNLIPFYKYECYGVDFSKDMLKKSKLVSKKYNLNAKLYKSNLDKLSLKDDFFDYALMLASLHNLETPKKRLDALKELKRILKKDGVALILVWNKWQLRFLFRKKDLIVPWEEENKIYNRYYHLFNYFELRNLLKKVNFKILESGFYKKNIMFVVKK